MVEFHCSTPQDAMRYLTTVQFRELRLAELAQDYVRCPIPMGDEWFASDTDWVKYCGTIDKRMWNQNCLHSWNKGENCGSKLHTRFGTWQALACVIPTIEEED